MLFLSYVCYAFVRVCLLLPCCHLLGKGWPLGSRLWYLIMSLLLSHWYPGSGVVLDCIDSWSLPSFLLCPKERLNIIERDHDRMIAPSLSRRGLLRSGPHALFTVRLWSTSDSLTSWIVILMEERLCCTGANCGNGRLSTSNVAWEAK